MTTSPEALREQPFERYQALASWIERLANHGTAIALGDWMAFMGALKHALTTAEQGGEKHLAEVARLHAALQEAREALGPFASAQPSLDDPSEAWDPETLFMSELGHDGTLVDLTAHDFRRAAEVHRALSPGEGG